MNSIDLAKKLISIPSFVDGKSNESQVGEFIYQDLKNFVWLKVIKQYVTKDRFNVFAYDKSETKILITGHIDTVQPQNGWSKNPFNPIAKQGKIYGLGSSDMKASVACILQSIKEVGPTKGCAYLFYIDEEYDFLGTKKFIEKYQKEIKPKIIVSGDGEGFKFGTSCRGLIEITFKIKGKSGHAASSSSGNNAIYASLEAISTLKKQLKKSSLNIAFIKGGLKQNDSELGKQGNIIADYCEFVVDIRPSSPDINANFVIDRIETKIKKLGCEIISADIRHNLTAWKTDKKSIEKFLSLDPMPKFIEAKDRGYVDIQMLWSAFDKVPCFTYGLCEDDVAHKPDEYVKIKSIKKFENFFSKLISMYN